MSVVGVYNANQLTSSSTKDSKKKFTKSFDLSQIAEDPMDSFLDTLGLWKKRIARDGSCLFRAVAEQIYPCQQYHEKVRLECINYMSNNRDEYSNFLNSQITFDHYLDAMKNSLEYGGQLEIIAMSKLYKRDFIIYQHPNQPGIDVTQNNFINKIYLCYSYNNHFDAIFTKAHRDRLALIQSLVYEILYDKVFGSGEQVTIARRLLRKSDTIYPKEYMKIDFENEENIELNLIESDNNSLIHESDLNINNESLDNDDVNDEEYNDQNEKDDLSQESEIEVLDTDINENNKTKSVVRLGKKLKKGKANSFNEKHSNIIHKMPLPYKVAKSLDPVIYRNTAFDAWLAAKKEHEEAANQKAISILQQGDKCLVRINNNYNEKWTLAFFQNMMHDSANVYIPELNENHCVLLENIKVYNNLNDISNLHHLQNFHISYGNNLTIQNVQKLVLAVNSQFSKIYLNNENKRRNLKKKQFTLKKSSSFHAFSTDLPTLVEVEEQNDEFFFYTNQLYGTHNYLSIPHHSNHHNHHPNLYQSHHNQNNIHVNSNPVNNHHHHHHQLANSFFSLQHSQSHQNFSNEHKPSISNSNKTNSKMISSSSASSLQNISMNNSSNLSNNFSTTNINTNNSNNKSRRLRFNQNNGSGTSTLNNNSYSNLNLTPLMQNNNFNNTSNSNNNSNNNNNNNNNNNSCNNNNNNSNNNNKIWPINFSNQLNMNIAPNGSFFGHNHHSLPQLSANQIPSVQNSHLASVSFNQNPINLAPLVPPPSSAGFLQPHPPPPTSHLHPHPNQVTSSILPPPTFIHPSPISHGLNQPPAIHSHGPPHPTLPHQQPRPNYFNHVSSPFMLGPLVPSQIGTPTLPPPQQGPGHFNHQEQQNTLYFSSGTNLANNTINSSNNSSSVSIQKNSSNSVLGSFSEHQRKNENTDNFLNKDIANSSNNKNNNIYQQVPHHLSNNTALKNSSVNNPSSTNDLTPIQPLTNTSNYLLMPVPPNTVSNLHHSYNSLTRSQSYHSGITNSPYDTNQNTSGSNPYVDVYIPQGNPNNLSQNTNSVTTTNNNNNNNSQTIPHIGSNNSNNNNSLPVQPQLNNSITTNPLSTNSSNTQIYNNNSNSGIGFDNISLNYGTNNFPNYEVQYSRFDNSLSNSNGFIDENLLNFSDSRHINLWSKNGKSNKNNNLLSDIMYTNDPNHSNLSTSSNQQFCYSNCFVVNIDGPINFNSTHSLLDDGSDLPLNDTNTMRFFYNLGIEYYRLNLAVPYNQGSGFYTQNQTMTSTTNTSNSNTLTNSLNQSNASNSNSTNAGSDSTTSLSSNNSINSSNANSNNNNNSNNNYIIPNDQQLAEKPSQSLNSTAQQVVPTSLTTNINKIQSNQFYNSRRGH